MPYSRPDSEKLAEALDILLYPLNDNDRHAVLLESTVAGQILQAARLLRLKVL